MRALAVVLFAAVSMQAGLGQRQKIWREYTYPADGFAITLPAAPTVNPSPALPGATAYLVHLGTHDSLFVLRAKTVAECETVISGQKEALAQGKDSNVDRLSLKDISIDHRAGLEYRRKSNSDNMFDRWYCADGHLYVFSVKWPSTQPFPNAATRILNSFRIITKEQR